MITCILNKIMKFMFSDFFKKISTVTSLLQHDFLS